MCVHGYVGVKNIDNSVTFMYGCFDTNTLGLWLHCNISSLVKIKSLLKHGTVVATEEKETQIVFNESPHIRVVENVELFELEALSVCESAYLWDNRHWLEKTKESDWHEIG